jgi:hypothetical protein
MAFVRVISSQAFPTKLFLIGATAEHEDGADYAANEDEESGRKSDPEEDGIAAARCCTLLIRWGLLV